MRLKTQTITITAPRELHFEVVAAGGRRIEKRTESEWVVEIVTEAMGRKVRTVELLNLDRPRAIRYRWLEGPIPDVEESILFTAIDDNKTQLTYVGRISFDKGPIGWLIARLRVKRLFERLVHEHLEQAKEVAEKRAQRSRVHHRRPPPDDAGRGGAIKPRVLESPQSRMRQRSASRSDFFKWVRRDVALGDGQASFGPPSPSASLSW